MIERPQFRDLLVEAQLIEARANYETVVKQEQVVPVAMYYEFMLADHGITEERFRRTFEYYASRPKELKTIYEEVVEALSRRKDALDAQSPGPSTN